jgi:hypothetical protein
MALAVVAILPMGMTAGNIDMMGGDTTEPEYCAGCHFPPGNVVMPEVVDDWYESDHANSYAPFLANTYCAQCHSPFQADATADHDQNDPVARKDWQGVTCGVCHPPHDLRVEWGTPIGTYDIESEEWSPVYEENQNDVCLQCHSGDSQGYGNIMSKKIGCVGCHMQEVDNDVTGVEGEHISHSFNIPDAESCGVGEEGCHPNKDIDWAEKQTEKGIHEKEPYGQKKDKGK